MMIRRWILASLLSATLLATAGCQAGGVVYVDEQGRELAVDGAGRPILTPPARAPMRKALPSLATTEPAALPPTNRAPTGQPPSTPAADPSWGLAPAAASGLGTLPTEAPAQPPKKVDSSAVLDLPPAG